MSCRLLLTTLVETYRQPHRGSKEAITDHFARRLVPIGVVMIGLLALAACGGGDETPSSATAGTLVVRGAEYSFKAPDTIAAGQAMLRFTNEGREDHDLQFMRLKDGVLIHQFQQSLHQDGVDAALRLTSMEGRVGAIGPAQTAEVTVNLPKGEYVIICLVTSPGDGAAHALKGMAQPLTVTAAP